ncbi:hypothetical protein JX265_000001 [Neoarthrinium moseri]|uniref:Uncharacterized protein n=1 Tax=Neoarthrinium moseri TaxID=1658444 RepID=A0A9Q0AWF2_9PEZI|nr:hypothetical protein JX266_008185 [Neoarthrinium moseri]KAI1881175.1 hypothetical protein JX265_000001 [Neoarthrinium moseri]
MSPDLNSLPPSSPTILSRTMNTSSHNGDGGAAMGTESPPSASRSQSISLQAAATMNAGLQRRSSSASRQQHSPAGRRRSTVLYNLQHNDPSVPSAGEMQEGSGAISGTGASFDHRTGSPHSISRSPLLTGGDPHHNRTPSLGELHQELEAEQEAQVNRLLQMIRRQQVELQQLQSQQGQSQSTVAAEDPTPSSERPSSVVIPSGGLPHQTSSVSTPRSPVISHARGSFDANRDFRPSRTPSSHALSPRMRSGSISGEPGEPFALGGRDETAFYQAETQSLVRENQMLRHRIRELERQLSEAHASSSVTREPAHPSHLLQSQSVSEEGGSENIAPGTEAPKAD